MVAKAVRNIVVIVNAEAVLQPSSQEVKLVIFVVVELVIVVIVCSYCCRSSSKLSSQEAELEVGTGFDESS